MNSSKLKIENKIIAPDDLSHLLEQMRSEHLTIATLNGSFDLLHAGHLSIIEEASDQADVLIMGINSDASIRSYKDESRPIVTLSNRLKMLSALQFVDYVTWFEETDPRKFLEIVKPDVHVNGVEYGEDCIEAEIVKKYGGRLHLVERVGGLSTTEIVEKVKLL